jgi:hypothetical protein
MSNVHLHWTHRHSDTSGALNGPHVWANYASLQDALEQAVADDGFTAKWITDESDEKVLADKDAIQAYAAAKAELEAKRDAAIEKVHADHAKALAGAAG